MPNISRRSILGTAAALMGTAGLGAAQAKPVSTPAKYDETSGYVKVPSQQLSDVMLKAFKDRLKDDK